MSIQAIVIIVGLCILELMTIIAAILLYQGCEAHYQRIIENYQKYCARR